MNSMLEFWLINLKKNILVLEGHWKQLKEWERKQSIWAFEYGKTDGWYTYLSFIYLFFHFWLCWVFADLGLFSGVACGLLIGFSVAERSGA